MSRRFVFIMLHLALLSCIVDANTVINIGYLAPFSGAWSGGAEMEEGVKMALEDVAADPTVLPGYELRRLMRDTQCDPGLALKHLFDLLNLHEHVLGLIGPGCSGPAKEVAGPAPLFHRVVVGQSPGTMSLSDKKRFPGFLRTYPHHGNRVPVLLRLCRFFGWTRLAVVAEPLVGVAVVRRDFFFASSSTGLHSSLVIAACVIFALIMGIGTEIAQARSRARQRQRNVGDLFLSDPSPRTPFNPRKRGGSGRGSSGDHWSQQGAATNAFDSSGAAVIDYNPAFQQRHGASKAAPEDAGGGIENEGATTAADKEGGASCPPASSSSSSSRIVGHRRRDRKMNTPGHVPVRPTRAVCVSAIILSFLAAHCLLPVAADSSSCTFSTISTTAAGVIKNDKWAPKYWGAAAVGTRVFFAPSNEDNVGVLDTATDTFSTSDTTAAISNTPDAAIPCWPRRRRPGTVKRLRSCCRGSRCRSRCLRPGRSRRHPHRRRSPGPRST